MSFVPSKEPGCAAGVPNVIRVPVGAVVVADVLNSDQGGFGAAHVAPLGDAGHVVVADDGPPEEVVRREEHEVPAAIAEADDRVVLSVGHVLVMAGEDEQVVGRSKLASTRCGHVRLG